jgi:diguanylate cyclase (GGDEF)-like protein
MGPSRRALRRLDLMGRLALASVLRFGVAGVALYVLLRADPVAESGWLFALALAAGLALLWGWLLRLMHAVVGRVRRQAADNEHAALHDPVTELPNRILLYDRLQQAILAAERDAAAGAVAVIDLARFKEVNETLGHHNGDLLLARVGARLTDLLRATDSVARLGADEFALVLRTLRDPHAAVTVVDKALRALAEPITLQGIEIQLEASAGIALHPEHGSDPERLVQRAEAAMQAAKRGSTDIEIYDPECDRGSAGRLTLLGELRRGIGDGSLILHYQPQVDVREGVVTGVEALVRWQHSERGLVPPGEFVPLAEGSGLIRPLTLEVLRQGIERCAGWHRAGLELCLAVNLSARNLLDVQLPDQVAAMLAEHGLPPARLELEVTESTLMSDPLRARGVMARLSEMGIGLAIDDFGTGYSSLAFLRQLPVDTLKVDRSFVMHMHEQEDDAMIVRSTIGLAHSLGLRTVAEGVETEAVLVELRELDCDLLQGFHLSRPLPADELERWLADCGWRAPARIG